MLEVRGLRKHFGGVTATDGVSLEVRDGEIHALIGPNGAGKTTLVGLICGSLAPDSGEVIFMGKNLTRAPQHARVAAGLARSFQVTSVFPRFTVLENLALAVQARSGSSFSFWKPVALDGAMLEEARSLAMQIELEKKQDAMASTLAHGERRALEVGLALATRARLLLLDEPTAGMGPEEARRMIELIERVAGRVSVLLVEHDMDAVFRLADRVSVLVNGGLIATGAPAEIRADRAVRVAYLGDEGPG
jgi:branched-chain amino acid transport system ATP-binding protein